MKALSIYLRDAIIYIPSRVQTVAGFDLTVGPVFVGEIKEKNNIFNAICERLNTPTKIVPTPTTYKGMVNVVVESAKFKSEKAFASKAFLWHLTVIANEYEIMPYTKGEKKGWVPDLKSAVKFSGENALKDAFEKLYTLILEKS